MSSLERQCGSTKFCVGCVHWQFDAGWTGTDVTGGTSWSSGCGKGHWQCEGDHITQAQYAAALLTANDCADYEERDVATESPPNGDSIGMTANVQFACVAKYEGDRGVRTAPIGDAVNDRLVSLQEDLADPACFEIVVFGDSFPTQIWRKVHGPD